MDTKEMVTKIRVAIDQGFTTIERRQLQQFVDRLADVYELYQELMRNGLEDWSKYKLIVEALKQERWNAS